MSVNKTIGGLSVLSSANIKGCYSLPVWDSDAQTTKSACITDILSGAGGSSIFVAGAGANSSIRCGVNNTASGVFGSALGGCSNSVSASFSTALNGVNNNLGYGCYGYVFNGINNSIVGCANACNETINISNFDVSGNNNCLLVSTTSTLSSVYGTINSAKSTSIKGNNNIFSNLISADLSTQPITNICAENNLIQGVGNSICTLNCLGGTNSSYSSYYTSHICNNAILGGCNHRIFSTTSNYQSSGYMAHPCVVGNNIIGGASNFICANETTQYNNLCENTILGGICNCVISNGGVYTDNNTIINGKNNKIGIGLSTSTNLISNVIAGGDTNNIRHGAYNTILGGLVNTINTNASSIILAGGRCNCVGGGVGSFYPYSAMIGGVENSLSGYSAFIGSANRSLVSGNNSAIISGNYNCVTNCFSFIGAGINNVVSGSSSNILGGDTNSIISNNSSIMGGFGNSAICESSFIAGVNITSRMMCALHANRLVVINMPTSCIGLPVGALYSDAGTIKIKA